MSRMCNIDDHEDIALYRNILHNDERQKISFTLRKDKCKKTKKRFLFANQRSKMVIEFEGIVYT